MKKYLSPKIKVVEFKVESGLLVSGGDPVLPSTLTRSYTIGMDSEIGDGGRIDFSNRDQGDRMLEGILEGGRLNF